MNCDKQQNCLKKKVPIQKMNDKNQVLHKLDQLKCQIKNTMPNCCLYQNKLKKSSTYCFTTKEIGSAQLLSESTIEDSKQIKKQKSKIQKIRENIIGFNTTYTSPFNIQLEAVYVDHTATNRPYRAVEKMVEYAKKFAANPHTEFSHFGKYSTQMMHYSHDSLLQSFSASKDQYIVLPTGSGSTGAIQKAIKIIKSIQIESSKPMIYITPYEHHSNILPWVQFYDNHVCIMASDQQGNLLMKQLLPQLLQSPTNNIIVTVSAASNVTSKLTNLEELNSIIKQVRKIKTVIFAVDCAAYCSHHQLNLEKFDQIDFAYISPHKNLGGAQTCGILIARKNIVKNAKPTFPGGGTVSFVKGYSKQDVMYDVDLFNRQIAGTPPFFGFYRAALCFQLLKNEIGYDFIHTRQKNNTTLFMKLINEANLKFKQNNLNTIIVVYGQSDFEHRANVVTFNIISNGKIVQHNFCCLIFADVFGIQLRSGCFCAGPFGMRLLNLDKNTVQVIEDEVSVGILRDKPGYMRLDLTFYLQQFEIEYLAKAIIGIAQYHHKMELVYTLCNDGQIKRHQLFKNILNNMYSLSKLSNIQSILEKDKTQNEAHLQLRQLILHQQLQRGIHIIQNPIQFLKTQVQRK